MRKKIILFIVFILLAGILFGCSSSQTVVPAPINTNQVDDNEQLEGSLITTYPLTIKDYTGNDVIIPAQPKRIITFYPSNTEILFELELADRVIAVTVNDDYPLNVQEKAEYIFTDGLNPNIEQALDLNPDLIVFGAHSDELIKSYINLNIPVVKYNPQSLNEVYQTIEAMGVITNTQEKSQQIIVDMKNKEKAITAKVSNIKDGNKKRVWVEVSSDLWTSGKETFMNELIEKAGGINVVDIPGWVQFSEEKVIEKNPEVIFTTYGNYDADAVKNVLTREGWSSVDAVKNNQVYDVDNNIVNRTGPRIVDAIEEFAKALYPTFFENE